MLNSTIENNIFYNIKGLVFFIADANSIKINNNLYKEIGENSKTYWLECHDNTNITFTDNLSINTNKKRTRFGPGSNNHNYTANSNGYYQSNPEQISDASDIIHTTDPTINYTDFVFTTDKYTNTPRTLTIPKIIENTNTQNHSPTATNVKISGTPEVGQTLTLNYKYSDPDGDTESESIIVWSTPTKELQKGTKKTFTIPKEYCGQTIGAWVRPKDSKGEMPELAIAASDNMLKITCKINEEEDIATFNFYPNPVDNIITISDNTDELKNYTISNLLGQKIATGILKENETINVRNYRPGTYFIKLSNDTKSITKKFIKL